MNLVAAELAVRVLLRAFDLVEKLLRAGRRRGRKVHRKIQRRRAGKR